MRNESKEKYKKIFKRKNLSTKAREKTFKEVIKECRNVKKCEYCGGLNGTVKHIQGTDATNIVHEKFK